MCVLDQPLPERVGEFNGDAEIAVCLVDTVHTNPQLSSVASTCCESKDGKKLQTTPENIRVSFFIHSVNDAVNSFNHD